MEGETPKPKANKKLFVLCIALSPAQDQCGN